MRIPILTYHSMRIDGNDYSLNDHVALLSDLRTISALACIVVPLHRIVKWLSHATPASEPQQRMVAITFDDGPDFDYYDLPHPKWGMQRSMLNIMRDFMFRQRQSCEPTAHPIHATSFVIVSPDARQELDRTCMIGLNWWRDEWWKSAVDTGLLSIGNHSWDHNHPTLKEIAGDWGDSAGNFSAVNNFDAAEWQIMRSAWLLQAKAPNAGTELFAYPYGEANDYLVSEYFPMHGKRIGIRAAFTCDPQPVTEGANRWMIPRYVFGRDWTTPDELVELLEDVYGSRCL